MTRTLEAAPPGLARLPAGHPIARVCGLTLVGVLAFGLILPWVLQAGYFLLALIGLAWLTARRQWSWSSLPGDEKRLILAVLAFLAVWVVGWLCHGAADEGTRALGRMARLLPIIPIVLLLRRIDGLTRYWWLGLTLGALLAGVYALGFTLTGQTSAYGARVDGPTNPIYFGGLALAFGLMLIPRLMDGDTGPAVRWLVLLAITLAFVANALSGARGAWPAVPIVLLMFAWTLGAGQPFRLRFGLPVLLIGLIVGIAATAMVTINARHAETIAEIVMLAHGQETIGAIGQRLAMWDLAGSLIASNPLWGVGPGVFAESLQQAVDSGRLDVEFERYRHPHSQYLSALLISGLPGLISLLALFGSALVLFARTGHIAGWPRSPLAWAGLVAIGVIGTMALTESIFERNAGVVWFGLLTAVLAALARPASGAAENGKHD